MKRDVLMKEGKSCLNLFLVSSSFSPHHNVQRGDSPMPVSRSTRPFLALALLLGLALLAESRALLGESQANRQTNNRQDSHKPNRSRNACVCRLCLWRGLCRLRGHCGRRVLDHRRRTQFDAGKGCRKCPPFDTARHLFRSSQHQL